MTAQEFIGDKVTYDNHGMSIDFRGNRILANIRGWSESSKIEGITLLGQRELLDSVGRFIVDAINEKIERKKEAERESVEIDKAIQDYKKRNHIK